MGTGTGTGGRGGMGGMMLYLPAYESTGKDGRRDISSVLGYENKYGQSEPTKRHVKTSSRMVCCSYPLRF